MTEIDSIFSTFTSATNIFFKTIMKTFKVSDSQQYKFEDTKGVIRSFNYSKKDRKYNGQKKKDKMTNNEQQSIHIKLKIE